MHTTSSFEGFSRDLISFFDGLADNNNKAWFDRHRKDYEALLLDPAKRFVAAMVMLSRPMLLYMLLIQLLMVRVLRMGVRLLILLLTLN